MSQFPVIELSGAAFERGRRHGDRARARVERSLANYAELFRFVGLSWDEAQRRAAPFRDVVGNFDASLLEELEGIAHGAGRPLAELLTLNARTEILPASFLTGTDPGECTAVAIVPAASATGGTLLAQNWDWVGVQRDSMVILRIREGAQPACVTLTEAGMLAKIGCNGAGFGVCLNILRSVFDGGAPGVPVHVLLRALLKRPNARDAVEFCSALAFGGSSNILCADRGGEAASLEFSPRGMKVLRVDGGTLCHTNHFLHAEAAGWQAEQAPNLSSEPRLRRARELAGALPKHGVDDLQRLLRDESDGLLSICRNPDRSLPPEARIETVASVVMELARGVMHIAPDVPSRAEYRPVGLASEGEIALA
ncbi:MAG TPA: C45 family peptidase [Burkholderiales bacterium]|jgi:isopenicillin-N N-acyltransferase-like protein|nr:C45 family peptidase [Burkholderiales bacterium]